MQKGRPPKNPVEELRVIISMNYLCFLSGIETGYKLEQMFEPHLIRKEDGVVKRSCKWDRYLKGVTPRKDSLTLIESKYPTVFELYCSSFWKALIVGKQSETYWINLYQSLSEEIRNLGFLYRSLRNTSSWNIGSKKNSILDKLFRIGNTESLTCLISLLRESSDKNNWISFDFIETRIFNLIFWIILKPEFFNSRHLLLSYMKQHFFDIDRNISLLLRESPWKLSNEDIDSIAMINNKNILIAEDLRLVRDEKEGKEFIYWKQRGDSFLIIKEMVNALSLREPEFRNLSEKGLKWLIEKLNKSRPKSRRIKLRSL
jgi:hypothetical protein